MSLPTPITSDVFADGELTNEVKWYNRIFAKINQLITAVNAQRVYGGRVTGVKTGGANQPSAAGHVIFIHNLGFTPSRVMVTIERPTGYAVFARLYTMSATQLDVFVYDAHADTPFAGDGTDCPITWAAWA